MEIGTKHTPGPWIINETCKENIMDENGYAICDIPYDYSSLDDDVLNANKALIISAPELLEALKLALHVRGTSEDTPDIEAAMRAAIAKAEGE